MATSSSPVPPSLLPTLVAPSADARIVIKNVRLFTGDEVINSGVLVLKAGKIVSVTQTDQAAGELLGDKDIVIDGHGEYTLLPGLCDCHVHFMAGASPNVFDEGFKMHIPELSIRAGMFAGRTLAAGFTSVRDLGSNDYLGVGLRKMIDENVVPGPHVIAAGQVIAMTGGHCDVPVHPCHCMDDRSRLAMVVDSVDEAKKAARTQIKYGVDMLKLIATGGVLTPGSVVGCAQLNIDEMQAAIFEANKAGKRVAAHAIGTQGIINALKAGVNTIEHGCCVDDEGIALFIAKGAYLIATLSAPHQISKGNGLPPYMVEKAKEVMAVHHANFTKAYKAGVKIALGTDSGTPFNHHGKNAGELEHMVNCGMTPIAALKAATKTATEAMGVEHDRGSLRVGLRADLVLVHGDPTTDVKILQDVSRLHVFKSGKLVAARGNLVYPQV